MTILDDALIPPQPASNPIDKLMPLHTKKKKNRKELMDFLNALAEESSYDGLTRPDTKCKIVQISNVTFYANNLKYAPLGARVTFPDHTKSNHGLVTVLGDNNASFFNVWLFIKVVINGGTNVMLGNCLMSIGCILVLCIMLLLILIYLIL